jgi:hypothetical protein
MPFPNQNYSKRDCHHRDWGAGIEMVEQARGIEPPILTLEKGHVLTLNYTRIRLKKSAVTQKDELYLRAQSIRAIVSLPLIFRSVINFKSFHNLPFGVAWIKTEDGRCPSPHPMGRGRNIIFWMTLPGVTVRAGRAT